MRYLLLVCWDAEKMDAQTEPEPTPDEESFPWLEDLQARDALGHGRPAHSAAPGPLRSRT